MRTNINVMAGMLTGVLLASSAALAVSPGKLPDGTWISISGTVQSMTDDTFVLNYGNKSVIIEMDDMDRFNEADLIRPGERVNVYGKIDKDFFLKPRIEAATVYDVNHGTFYFASAADEEELASAHSSLLDPAPEMREGDYVTVSGWVEEVDGREFKLSTSAGPIDVDVSGMHNNPLDDQGLQRVGKGDYVSVRGRVDNDLFDSREIKPDRIVEIVDRSGPQG